MPLERPQRIRLQRIAAALLALIGVPLLLTAASLDDDSPLRSGVASSRTIVTAEVVRVVDPDATDRAKRTAADNVVPVTEFDPEAQGEIIRRVRDLFTVVLEVRRPAVVEAPPAPEGEPQPAPTSHTPTEQEQLAALRDRVTLLNDPGLLTLIRLSDTELADVQRGTVAITQELARQRVTEADLARVLDEKLRVELAIRTFPGDSAAEVVEPMVRAVMRPTVRVDEAQTAADRAQASAEVADVVRSWAAGAAIVRTGDIVDDVQLAALEQVGLDGSTPLIVLLRTFGAMALVVVVTALYMRAAYPKVWASGRKVLLIATLYVGYTVLVTGLELLTESAGPGWWYALPSGALAMFIVILVGPAVGMTALPAIVVPLLLTQRSVAIAVFAVAAVLVGVPLVSDLSARGDLRKAAFRGAVAYPILAVSVALVFDTREVLGIAALAGLVNGLGTAILVQGILPFLESTFRVSTVTTLLDLADRNHPLLRELEQKAIGTYNHSVMTATLVERACRSIGANALLGSVAALYHDIGKVRRPHFFIENQGGIGNPHDEIEPQVSALIIQEHVVDGVKMAREFKLPPDVVAAIGSHHGTTLVKFFYEQAVERAAETGETVQEEHFRYKGDKPHSKEAAVLLIADCCEATTRSAAMSQGHLSRDAIEAIVDGLIEERVDDHQLAHADLTFAELSKVRDSVVESLVGVYHPRIAYPKGSASSDAARAAAATTAASLQTPAGTVDAPPVAPPVAVEG